MRRLMLLLVLDKLLLDNWSVLCKSPPIFGKMGFKLGNQLQFKRGLEHNTF
jgi:hypothetical protein